MVVKGHDFSGVTLVGVIGTDAQLYSADFRSVERLGQTLIQVAGRAGRGEKPGVVMVQTRFPHHHAIKSLEADGDGYREVAAIELGARAETGLPPFGHLAVALARSPKQGAALGFLREMMERAPKSPGVTLFGPMPTVIEKLGGEYRAQIVVSAKERSVLQWFLRTWVPHVGAARATHGLN